MSDDLLDRPATPTRLRALAAAGILDARALEAAFVHTGQRPTLATWRRYAHVNLLLVGAVLVAAGAVFFVAANWGDLAFAARFGIVAGGMAGCSLLGAWLGLDRLAGRAAALLAGLLFGPLIALYGQHYQTGADAWGVFAAWTLVMVGYSLVTRFSGAWITTLILGHLAVALYGGQELGARPESGVGALILGGLAGVDALAVGLLELATKRGGRERAVTDGRIVGWTAATFGLVLVTGVGLMVVVEGEIQDGQWLGCLELVAGLAAIFLVYRRARPDLFMLALAAMSVFALATAALGKLTFDVLDLDDFGFWFMGALVVGEVWLTAKWLLHWRYEHDAETLA